MERKTWRMLSHYMLAFQRKGNQIFLEFKAVWKDMISHLPKEHTCLSSFHPPSLALPEYNWLYRHKNCSFFWGIILFFS